MKIGNLKLKNDIFLGPMAGFTDYPMRKICKGFGAALTYTEMVSAKALYYGDKKTRKLLVREDDDCAAQIFGREPEIMAIAAKMLQDEGVRLIDINMGCPAPKITGNGEGSVLMKELDVAVSVADAVKNAVNIPVTVKMRRGWNCCPDAVYELSERLDNIGIDAICVHPRTREQFYSGQADWDVIKNVKKDVKCIVIGNGDVASYEDYIRMKEYTGCDAVMISREACCRPWIFAECRERRSINVEFEEKMGIVREHYRLAVDFYGEHTAITQMRKQFHCYVKGMPGAAKFKDEINRISTYDEVNKFFDTLI